MAIYHLSIKIFSRSKGQSATAAVAYRSGTKIKCEHEGHRAMLIKWKVRRFTMSKGVTEIQVIAILDIMGIFTVS